jgi:hypothetical protein
MIYRLAVIAVLMLGCSSSTYTKGVDSDDDPIAGAAGQDVGVTVLGHAGTTGTTLPSGTGGSVSTTNVPAAAGSAGTTGTTLPSGTGGSVSTTDPSSTGGSVSTTNVPAAAGSAGTTLPSGTGGAAGSPAASGGLSGVPPAYMTPKQVAYIGILVDQTEVTREQYGSFVVSGATALVNQVPECTTNSSFAEVSQTDPDLQRPANVDWCDAYAYCAAAGRRLCEITELSSACSSSGTLEYNPSKTCVSQLTYAASAPLAVGSRSCSNSGITDLTGNAPEWSNTCSGSKCQVHKSSYLSSTPYCSDSGWYRREFTVDHVGFRCCESQ